MPPYQNYGPGQGGAAGPPPQQFMFPNQPPPIGVQPPPQPPGGLIPLPGPQPFPGPPQPPPLGGIAGGAEGGGQINFEMGGGGLSGPQQQGGGAFRSPWSTGGGPIAQLKDWNDPTDWTGQGAGWMGGGQLPRITDEQIGQQFPGLQQPAPFPQNRNVGEPWGGPPPGGFPGQGGGGGPRPPRGGPPRFNPPFGGGGMNQQQLPWRPQQQAPWSPPTTTGPMTPWGNPIMPPGTNPWDIPGARSGGSPLFPPGDYPGAYPNDISARIGADQESLEEQQRIFREFVEGGGDPYGSDRPDLPGWQGGAGSQNTGSNQQGMPNLGNQPSPGKPNQPWQNSMPNLHVPPGPGQGDPRKAYLL